jgi:NitT/TauT family transport system substrate-binding protein
VGSSLWPGNAGEYVALEKKLFEQEGIKVDDITFGDYLDSVPAFLGRKVDILWIAGADALQMSQKDPSLRIIFLTDYSDGADGIIGRNINSPKDLKGKTVAREGLLSANVILSSYLKQGGLNVHDVTLQDMSSEDAVAAFLAGHLDAAVTYNPWLTQAAQQGNGKVIFTTKGTNLLSDVIVVRQELINQRRADLQAYLRAVDQGVKLVKTEDSTAIKIVADKLELSPEETQQQLSSIRLFDLEENQKIAFNKNNSESLLKNLEFTSQVAYELAIIPKRPEIDSLYDDSILKSL